MKCLSVLLLCGAASAQSLSITAPSSGQNLSAGFVTLASSCSSCPSEVAREYFIDGASVGVTFDKTTSPPLSIQWSPFSESNGPRQLVAKSYDALGTLIATSAAVIFTTKAMLPLAGWTVAPYMTVTSNPADGAAWTGSVSITATINDLQASGSCSGNPMIGFLIDGVALFLPQTSAAGVLVINFDSSKFTNGPHRITVSAWQNNDIWCGEWQRTETFSNTATLNTQLLLDSEQVFLTPGGTHTFTASFLRTDGSLASASPAYSVDSTHAAICSMSGAVLTATGNGLAYATTGNYCNVTATVSGFSRTAWVFVVLSNSLAHFDKNGSARTTYSAANSFTMNTLFFSDDMFKLEPAYGYSTAAADMLRAGFNTAEVELGTIPSGTQPAFNAGQTALMNTYQGYCNQGIMLHGKAEAYGKDSTSMYTMIRGTPSTWTPPALTKAFQDAHDLGCFVGVTMSDEFNYGSYPQPPIPQMGVSLTSIVCTSGACTGTMPGGVPTNQASQFIIRGATTNTCLNNATGTEWTMAGRTTTTFNFTATGCGSFTANGASDPNLVYEPFWVAWHGTDGLRYDNFAVLNAMRANVTNATLMNFPLIGGAASPLNVWNVEGNPGMSQYAEAYWSYGSFSYGYHPNKRAIQDEIGTIGLAFRLFYASVPGTPIILETTGIAGSFGVQGVNCNISSITDDLVTFAAPCWPATAPLYPGVSRLGILGTSNSAYNGGMYISDSVDASHVKLYRDTNNISPAIAGLFAPNAGNMLFNDGVTLTIHYIDTNSYTYQGVIDYSTFPCSGTTGVVVGAGTFGALLDSHRGQPFRVAGSTNSTLNNTHWWYPRESHACGVSTSLTFREQPAGSATGGTAELITSDYYEPGRNATFFGMYPLWDYSQFFIENFYSYALGSPGQRAYQVSSDSQLFSPTNGFSAGADSYRSIFHDTSTFSNGNQRGFHPRWDNGFKGYMQFAATSYANLFFTNRIAKYYLGATHLNSPDCGKNFETFAYSSTAGKMLIVIPMHDGALPCTVDLTPYISPGQNYLKYTIAWNSLTWSTVGFSTTADTTTYTGAVPAVFLFPTTYASDAPSQPAISVRLADIPNATKVVVRWAYHPLLVDLDTNMAADCGTGSCSLPVDGKVASIYYRLLYLGANSAVLATSDIQTL